eukprot:594853-Pleurochrysis_carterae.AAC.9
MRSRRKGVSKALMGTDASGDATSSDELRASFVYYSVAKSGERGVLFVVNYSLWRMLLVLLKLKASCALYSIFDRFRRATADAKPNANARHARCLP